MQFNFPMKQLILAAAILFGCQAIFAQTPPPDSLAPEVSITSPSRTSKHNFFPIITGTVKDSESKDYNGVNVPPGGVTVPPSGVATVLVSIFADGKIWNGRDWVTMQPTPDFYQLEAEINGENWQVKAGLPTALKTSQFNSQEKIRHYVIGVYARDNAGNYRTSSVNLYIEEITVSVLDANKMFSGIDLSDDRRSVNNADLENLINLIAPRPDSFATTESAGAWVTNLYKMWRYKAVADGATKLLVIGKGVDPGTMTFGSTSQIADSGDWTEFLKNCNTQKPANIAIGDLPSMPGFDQQKWLDGINWQINKRICSTGDAPIVGDKFTKVESNNPATEIMSFQRGEEEYYWLALYTVPPDIPADVSANTPNSAYGHAISLTASFTPSSEGSNSQPLSQIKTPLFLKRPPVLLVHGLNDNSDSWDLDNNMVLQDAGFDVHLLDYRDTNGRSFQRNRLIFLDRKSIEEISEPFVNPRTGQIEFIKKFVEIERPGIPSILAQYREAGIAISKVDVVAHSMGGNLARVFQQQTLEYLNNDNLQKGYFRRLITIGTPHLGSNISNIVNQDLKDKKRGCAAAALLYEAAKQGTLQSSIEANIDLAIGSEALKAIENTPISSHAITTTAFVLRDFYIKRYNLIWLCPYTISGLEIDCEENFIYSSCGGVVCDLVVSQHSQLGGLKNAAHSTSLPNINHGEQIGSIPVRQRVAQLLLGGEENFAGEGFPAVKTVSPPPISLDTFPIVPTPLKQSKAIQPKKPLAAATPKLINKSQQPAALQIFKGGDLFRLEVPTDWKQESSGSLTITFTPADGMAGGEIVRGAAIEATAETWESLDAAMDVLTRAAQTKKDYLQVQQRSAATLGNHQSIVVRLAGRGESIVFHGTLLKNGNLLYVAFFSPENEQTRREPTFRRMLDSFRITD